MSTHNAAKAARLIGSMNWRTIQQRHDDPVNFLVFVLDCAVAAIGDAALDKSARPEQRTAAAYALSGAIRTSTKLLEKAHEYPHEAIPDAGIQEAVADAVDALHRIANQAPHVFRNLGWFTRWPVNLAADGRPFESSVLLHQLPEPLGARFTGFVPSQKKRPPAVGGRWNALALELHGRAGPHANPLRAPRGRASKVWPAWNAVEKQMDHERTNILNRPEVRRWKAGKRVSLLKEGAQWAELKKEIKRSLLTLAQGNDLARKKGD